MSAENIIEDIIKNQDGAEKRVKELDKKKNKEKEKTLPNKDIISKDSKVKSGNEDAFAKLTKILSMGFQNLESTISGMGSNIADKVSRSIAEQLGAEEDNEMSIQEERDEDEETVTECEYMTGDELLGKLEKDFSDVTEVGKDVPPSIASLVNMMLSKRGNPEAIEERGKKYLRPKNVAFASAPKINKQVWLSMSASKKMLDKKLQDVQRQFLLSTVPIMNVIKDITQAKSEGTELDLGGIIHTLSDAVAFVGSSNLNMVQTRKENIKEEIPQNLKSLCSMEIPFTGEFLFGDNLSQNMKDITETKKLSDEFQNIRGTNYTSGRVLNHNSYGINRRPVNVRGQSSRGFQKRGRFFHARGRGTSSRFQSRRGAYSRKN